MVRQRRLRTIEYRFVRRRPTTWEAVSDPWFWVSLACVTFIAVLWYTNPPGTKVARAIPTVLR